jgi:hypothetical protein
MRNQRPPDRRRQRTNAKKFNRSTPERRELPPREVGVEGICRTLKSNAHQLLKYLPKFDLPELTSHKFTVQNMRAFAGIMDFTSAGFQEVTSFHLFKVAEALAVLSNCQTSAVRRVQPMERSEVGKASDLTSLIKQRI